MKLTSASNPHFDGKVAHLMAGPEDISPIVLLPGDPGRVKMYGEFLENFKIISQNREFTLGTGFYKGVKITVCSTGIGARSTEIAVVELCELGAKCLIRTGGCGVMKKEIECGDMVINTAAIRKGGSSLFYAPPEYPAVASFEVTRALLAACRENKVARHTGIAASVGSFFAGQGRPAAGRDFGGREIVEYYKKLGVLNMEMECETVMTLGSLLGVMTGSICAVHANRETDRWLVDFEPAQRKMCKCALDACVIIKDKYLD